MTKNYYILLPDKTVKEVDLMEWATWLQNAKGEWVVAYDEVADDVEVSTVFIGLNHNFDPDGPPEIFETMVFRDGGGVEYERWSTYDEALAGHKKILEELKNEQ